MTNNSNRWKFLFTACLVNFCTGSIYAWSVFAGPKAEQMSQLNNVLYTAGDLAIVFGLANAVGPLPDKDVPVPRGNPRKVLDTP